MSGGWVRLFLVGGQVHEGYDERDIDDIVESLDEPDNFPELPKGWTWAAGLTFRASALVGIRNFVPEEA